MIACALWRARNQGCRDSALSQHRYAQAAASHVPHTFDSELIFDHCICRNVFLLPRFSQPQSLSCVAENEFPAHGLRHVVRGCVYEFHALDLDSNLMKESPVHSCWDTASIPENKQKPKITCAINDNRIFLAPDPDSFPLRLLFLIRLLRTNKPVIF